MLYLEAKKNISLDQKHSSQVARIYNQKNTSRLVAVDGQISMRKFLGGESNISKASLKEIENGYHTDKEEDDVESSISCLQASPQKSSK